MVRRLTTIVWARAQKPHAGFAWRSARRRYVLPTPHGIAGEADRERATADQQRVTHAHAGQMQRHLVAQAGVFQRNEGGPLTHAGFVTSEADTRRAQRARCVLCCVTLSKARATAASKPRNWVTTDSSAPCARTSGVRSSTFANTIAQPRQRCLTVETAATLKE